MSRVKKRQLYLFTDAFPWGPGEKTFVAPELKYLAKSFDITIVSGANPEMVKHGDMLGPIPNEIEIITYNPCSRFKAFAYSLNFFFSKAGRRELSDLKKDGFSFARLKDSLYCYADAIHQRKSYKKLGLFESNEAIYYSYWFNSHLLALILEKNSSDRDMKIVSRIHGYDLYNHRNSNGRQPFQRFKRDNCDRVFFLSESAKKEFEYEFGKETFLGQYSISRLGVERNIPFNSKLPDSKGHKLIVSCSSVIPLKRVGLIAEALVELNRNDVHWVHFGDGPQLNEIKEYARRNGLSASFMGNVPNKLIMDYYSSNIIDSMVLLSETEGSPVCIQEALSFGIPIIATNVGGVSEEVDRNGVLLSSNPEVDEVAEALSMVLDALPDEVKSMRQRSLEIWADKFDGKKNKESFVKQLESL